MKSIETMCIKCKVAPQLSNRRICRECKNQQTRDIKRANPQAHRDYWKQYYKTNGVKVRARANHSYALNPAPVLLRGINKRAKKFGLEPLKAEDLARLLLQKSCEDCGTTENLSIGHRIPMFYPTSSNNYDNLIRQCFHCNTHLQGFKVHISAWTPELAVYYRFYTPSAKSK